MFSLSFSYYTFLFFARFEGKESGPTVTAVESTSQSNAVSERDAMALLTRFQFPSKRWCVPYVLHYISVTAMHHSRM